MSLEGRPHPRHCLLGKCLYRVADNISHQYFWTIFGFARSTVFKGNMNTVLSSLHLSSTVHVTLLVDYNIKSFKLNRRLLAFWESDWIEACRAAGVHNGCSIK